MALWSQRSPLAPCTPPFKLLSKGLFHFFDSTWSPLGSCKAGTIDGFHILIGEVMGLQSSFVFYGPRGTACAVCWTGITIQREGEREFRQTPLLQIKHTPYSRALPHSPRTTQVVYASSHLLVKTVSSDDIISQLCLSLITLETEYWWKNCTEHLIKFTLFTQ